MSSSQSKNIFFVLFVSITLFLSCATEHEFVKGSITTNQVTTEGRTKSGETIKGLLHNEEYHKSHHHFVKFKNDSLAKTQKIPLLDVAEIDLEGDIFHTLHYRLKDGSIHHTFAKKIKGNKLQLYQGIADVSAEGKEDHYMTYFLVKKINSSFNQEVPSNEEVAVFALPNHYSERYIEEVKPLFTDNEKALSLLINKNKPDGLEFANQLISAYEEQ